jgi:hypothetical protein
VRGELGDRPLDGTVEWVLGDERQELAGTIDRVAADVR